MIIICIDFLFRLIVFNPFVRGWTITYISNYKISHIGIVKLRELIVIHGLSIEVRENHTRGATVSYRP
jgi:lipoate-protein ligase B